MVLSKMPFPFLKITTISFESVIYLEVAPSLIQTALSYDQLFVITFSFLMRWLRNFAKNNRDHSAIIDIFRYYCWQIFYFMRNQRLSRPYCLKKISDIFLLKILVSAFIDITNIPEKFGEIVGADVCNKNQFKIQLRNCFGISKNKFF